MGETGEVDESAEVAGDELRTVVGDDPRAGAGVGLEGTLKDELDVGLGHAVEELPVHDEAAVAVEDRAQVVVDAGDGDDGDVDMPVHVRAEGLDEAGALLG